MKNVKTIFVEQLPKCDFCDAQAAYDAKTKYGPWANMCQRCFWMHGIGLGIGRRQKLQEKKNRLWL